MTDDGYPHRVGGFVRIMFGWPLRPRLLNTPPGGSSLARQRSFETFLDAGGKL
jgi:hypothetical protein